MKFSLCYGSYRDQDVYYHLNKVKEHGFQGLEFYNLHHVDDLKRLRAEQEKLGVVINATVTRFFDLVDAGKREQYISGLKETIEDCKVAGVRSIITQTGNVIPGLSREAQIENMIETLKRCAELCERADVVLELEPLNELDHPGHFLQRSDEAVRIVDAVGSEHVKLVFDVYHQQITEGDVTRSSTRYLSRINHFHIADNPGRKQPGTGELNYVNILRAIRDAGFEGFVALECGYTKPTDEALDEVKRDILSKVIS